MIFHDACVYAFGLNFKKSFIKKIAIPTESEKRQERYYYLWSLRSLAKRKIINILCYLQSQKN